MGIMLKGKDNVYEQIVNEYKRLIELNVIRTDEKLPSCRQLAIDLGVNPNTVSRAYSVLEEEGYIIAIPKKGVYVCYEGKEDSKKAEYVKTIKSLKDSGLSYDELLKIVNDVYKGE